MRTYRGRLVLAVVCTAGLAIGAALVVLWYANGPARAIEGVRDHIGVELPSNATNIEYTYSQGFNYFGFLRLDLPRQEVPAFLAQNRRLPKLSEFRQDEELLSRMAPPWSRTRWWNPGGGHEPRCAATTGRRAAGNRPGSVWRWSYVVCLEHLGEDAERVYVFYNDDPRYEPG